jgi:hypothetical protein
MLSRVLWCSPCRRSPRGGKQPVHPIIGHVWPGWRCTLIGAKQTWRVRVATSEIGSFDMPTDRENVCSLSKTGRKGRPTKMTRLTHSRPRAAPFKVDHSVA